MEQGPKARDQEPDKVKVDLKPERAAKGPAQIPAADREKDKAEDRVEAKATDKVRIEVVIEKNNINDIHERKIIV
jgi:hypothetical protein